MSRAGKLEKAFEALSVYNYFEAKDLFQKSLKAHRSGASYGLSLIFSNDKNPFYHLDSARKYILYAENHFPFEKVKEQERLAILGVVQTSIDEQKIKVAELAFEQAKLKMEVRTFTHFINMYRYSSHFDRAVYLRDSLAFEDASRQDSYTAYYEFMKTYTRSEFR